MIRAGVGFSDKFSPPSAVAEALSAARTGLAASGPPSSAMVFATAAWGPGIPDLVRAVADELDGCPMLGASVAGLFSGGRGTAENPGLAIALFTGLEISSVCFDDLNASDSESGREILDHLSVSPDAQNPLLLLSQFGQRSPEALLDGLNTHIPDTLMMGLGASPLPRGKAAVWCDGEVLNGGTVAAVLKSAAQPRWGVSRACREASTVHRVTRSRDRWIGAMDDQPALGLLEDVARLSHLPASTESLRQLLVEVMPDRTGEAQSPTLESDGSTLYNVVGIDPRRSAILLPEHIEAGATVRFAVRDAVAARENLEELVKKQIEPDTAFGLYLSGTSLDRAGETGAAREARCFHERAPDVPVLGLRGAQLLGPARGRFRSCGVLTDTSLLASFEN